MSQEPREPNLSAFSGGNPNQPASSGNPPSPCSDAISQWLVSKLAEELQIDPEEIDIHEPFTSYGISSVLAVSLSGDLEDWLGRPLSPTLVFDFPTIEALAKHLSGEQEADSKSLRGQEKKIPFNEPVAVIGLACRVPGAEDTASFWQLLREGRDAITEVPAERWDADAFYHPDPAAPGKMNTRWGGFLKNIDQFDASFFGISPREAARMDPQQRLLLEVAWEALEDAGLQLEPLRGSQTGVFIGLSTHDYQRIQMEAGDPAHDDPYSGTGTAGSIASGRLSYCLGFQGPSLSVDTACSSSLTALHLACQSLKLGECDLAVVGGVNLILSPQGTIYFTKMRAMAPDGRCKVFDASADGYVRGEGCAVVVLKRLSEALQDSDSIRAVIRGSALTHDGRSSGLTVPNGQSQQSVIRQALDAAGVHPAEISFIEAHGTGTALGDPIELQALSGVFGNDRDSYQSLMVGSVKSNIGHLEASAGIVGLAKVILSLEQEEIPPHLHFKNPTPHVDWNHMPIEIPVARRPWKQGDRKRIAGISSFGFSGTNVHVIVEEAPQAQSRKSGRGGYSHRTPRLILPLSARSESALRLACSSMHQFLNSRPQASRIWLRDACYSAATRRTHHDYRVVLQGNSRDELLEQLSWFARGKEPAGNLFSGRKPIHSQPKAGFHFVDPVPGWSTCSRSLLDEIPAFREAVEECEHICREIADHSILHEMDTPSIVARIDCSASSPCAYTAFQIGLARVLQSWGITPQAITGQGSGLVAAACLAGCLDLSNAFRILLAGQTGISEPSISLSPAQIPLFIPGEGWISPGNMPEGLLAAIQASDVKAGLEGDSSVSAMDALIEIGPLACPEDNPSQSSPIRIPVPRGEITSWETDSLYRLVALLYSRGFEIRWQGLFPDGGRYVKLPAYPWQHERFWIERSPQVPSASEVPKNRTEDSWKNWLYRPVWVEAPLEGPHTPAEKKQTWLLFADQGGIVRSIGKQLEERGDTTIFVFRDQPVERKPADFHVLDRIDKKSIEALLQSIHPQPIDKILYGWPLDAGPGKQESPTQTVEDSVSLCSTFATVLQGLVGNLGASNSELWVITRDTQPLPGREASTNQATAPLAGFCTSAAGEHPALWGGMIDIDSNDDPLFAAHAVLDEITSGSTEDRVAFSEGRRHVQRLLPFDASQLPPPPVLRGDATYLVTGGYGDLGIEAARHLVENGARRLVLLGRTALPPRNRWNQEEPTSPAGKAIRAIRQLEHLGAAIHPARVDLSSPKEFADFLDAFHEEGWPPVRGIIHAAGQAVPGSILDFNPVDFQAMLSSKAEAVPVICRCFKPEDLDFICFFSSASSILESPFLGGYAAANAFLDCAAHKLHRLGYSALAFNWGFWDEIGMAAQFRKKSGRDHLSKGTRGIPTAEGFQIFDRFRSADVPQVMVLPIDWGSWREAHPTTANKPLFREIWRSLEFQTLKTPSLTGERKSLELLARLTGLSDPEKESILLEAVLGQTASVLDLDAGRIAPDDPLDQLGIDSLMAVELRNWLEVQLGVVIPMTDLLKGPTVRSITLGLLKEISRIPHTIEPARSHSQEQPGHLNTFSSEDILGRMDHLSEDEVDRLLHNLLSEDKGGR